MSPKNKPDPRLKAGPQHYDVILNVAGRDEYFLDEEIFRHVERVCEFIQSGKALWPALLRYLVWLKIRPAAQREAGRLRPAFDAWVKEHELSSEEVGGKRIILRNLTGQDLFPGFYAWADQTSQPISVNIASKLQAARDGVQVMSGLKSALNKYYDAEGQAD